MVQFCYLRLYFGIDTVSCHLLPVADPDLQISGGRSSRPWDKGGGGGGLKKKFFRPLASSLSLIQNKGGAGPPSPTPGSATSCNGLQRSPATRYVRDWSDNESDEEGDFEIVYGRTCITRSVRSVRGHDWCVWIFEAGVILMVFRLPSFTTLVR